MSSPTIDTPPPKPKGTAPSPSRKSNGIDLDKQYLPRQETINSIYRTALAKQYVVIGSPASTGKTSLLTILREGLEKKGANILLFFCQDDGIDRAQQDLDESGFPRAPRDLEKLENTWLLIDDAQNHYAPQYEPLWTRIVKKASSLQTEGKLFVVIAATYDLATPGSPVNFRDIDHIDPNICGNEANQLIQMHLEYYGYGGWEKCADTLLGLSKMSGRDDTFHVGVIMAAMRLLEDIMKYPGMNKKEMTEDYVLDELRGASYAQTLHRCFKMPEAVMTKEVKGTLLGALLSTAQQNQRVDHMFPDGSTASIGPLIRSGLITQQGRFSCAAAQWYYNRYCFPNRALERPETLRDLIVKAVGSMSAKRLRDSEQAGFPKEAAFQHLFNEAMSVHLPKESVVIPELNTRAFDSADSQDPTAEPVTGELDFYVNGNTQWCIEIDRKGDMIGKHLGRFHCENGKYRKVATKDYYVVDCRGPKVGGGVQLKDPHRCTLYFAKDFSTCRCEIHGEKDENIDLSG